MSLRAKRSNLAAWKMRLLRFARNDNMRGRWVWGLAEKFVTTGKLHSNSRVAANFLGIFSTQIGFVYNGMTIHEDRYSYAISGKAHRVKTAYNAISQPTLFDDVVSAPGTEGIKYAGSKLGLLPHILQPILRL